MQLTFRQVFVYFVGVVLMAAVTWWFFTLNQAAAEREKLLQAQAEKQDKKLGAVFDDAQKETGEIKKLVEALALAHANRKSGEPLPTVKLAPAPPSIDQKALAKARLKSLEGQVQEIRATLDKAHLAMKRWDARVKSVLTGNEGKKIAADRVLAEQFAALVDKARMEKFAMDSVRDKAETLMAPMREADRDGKVLVLPSETILKEVESLLRTAVDGLRAYEQDWDLLETLVADSARQPMGDKTLETVVLELSAERNRKRAEAVAAAKKEAFAEATKQIAEAEALLEKQRGDLEAQRIGEIAKTEKIRKDYEIAKLAIARKREELVAKYELTIPDIKLHLAPFLANGYAQPNGKYLKKEAKAQPMSYSRMVSAGALLPNRPGLECLLYLGGSFNNDRYLGNFPKHVGGEFGWERADKVFLQRTQDLLRDFGPILVEKGLLTP